MAFRSIGESHARARKVTMADATPALEIRHDAALGRFVVTLGGRASVADYQRAGDTLQLVHTEVPRELRGRGIAAALVAAALTYAGDHGLTVVPLCSYARAYIRRHPETRRLLAPGAVV
jgi:predicted GNAT family acetyltransferase